MVEQANIVKGSLFALAGFFCMALFGIITKVALQGGSPLWISFIAYLTGAAILAAYIAPRGFAYLRSDHLPLLVGRALFGTAASLLYTISIQYIPIVNGTLLFNTAPIFIPILAVLFLRISISPRVWLAVALGFAGILIIIKPTLAIFTQPGDLVGLLSGISLAVAYFMMKLLTSTETAVRIIFYYLGIGALVQLPLLMFAGNAPSSEEAALAAASGVVLLVAQLALVRAYSYADASQVGIYQYSTVVFVGVLNALIWGQIPPPVDLAGVALVAAAGTMIIRSRPH